MYSHIYRGARQMLNRSKNGNSAVTLFKAS